MRKLAKGAPITDSTKGSLEYSIYEVDRAFRQQFGYGAWNYCICDTFADHIILRDWELPQDEYWMVTYTHAGDTYTFALQAEWERVQLDYIPAKNPAPPDPADDELAMGMGDARIRRRTFVERIGTVQLLDAVAGAADGRRRVRGVGMTIGGINENRRRYPRPVVEDAVNHALEQYGNPAGRIGRGPLLGESEHPGHKHSRPLWQSTVFVWDSLKIEGNQVIVEGYIVPTKPDGENAIILLDHGVQPGLSQRSYGRSVLLQESGGVVEELQEMELIGFDATIDPADMNADLVLTEARRSAAEEQAMHIHRGRQAPPRRAPDTEANPAGGTATNPPAAATPPVTAPLTDSLSADDRARLDRLAESERRAQVGTAIDTALAAAPYEPAIRQQIADAVRGLDLPNVDAVVGAVERQRAVADAMLSQAQLALMGRPSPRGPILSGGDSPASVPDYAKPQLAITDSLMRATFQESHLARVAAPRTVNERFTAEYLRRYDAKYKPQLIAESRLFQDAEQASDLSLPYTVMRTILTELLPTLVATSIFDVQSVDATPIVNIGYETYQNETGVALTVTDEAVTSHDDTWVSLAHQHLTFGTVVLTSSPAGTTYIEDTDYVVDYLGGRVMTLAGGAINDATALLIDYGYSAVRKGEMAPIERGKMTLAFYPLTIAADRLGTQISSEAIVFSRGVLGYDVVGRNLQRIIFELRRIIDGGLMRLALAEALRIANNSAGTWNSSSDTYDDLAALIGQAKVKVANRFFEPTGTLMSLTNADRVANWNAFTAAGARDDAMMNATGYVGRIKGTPVFASTEFPDTYIEVINREIVYYRIAQPMQIKGPFPSYDPAGTGKMVAADQYYVEEYNGATGDPGHSGKGSTVKIA